MDATLLLNEIKLYVDNMKNIIINRRDIKKYDYMPYITFSILMKMNLPNMNNNDTVKQIRKTLNEIHQIIYENETYKFEKDIITPEKYKEFFKYYHAKFNSADVQYMEEFDKIFREYTTNYDNTIYTPIGNYIKTPDIYPKKTKTAQELKISKDRT